MPPKNSGVIIESAGPAALKTGIKKGDTLISINGNPIHDPIDYMFYRNEPELDIALERDSKRFEVFADRELDLELAHFKVKTCRNKCIFCFVSQLPGGLRRTLYVRDEDYRMSFLYGNYITMTNLSEADKKRIVEQILSPLYISVHSTDRKIRNRILGSPDAADIMKELRFLSKNGIRTHTQIVMCPGINDGAVLKKTISDLYTLYPYVSSIAVVPVGLTAHRKHRHETIRPVNKEDANMALDIVEGFQKRFRKKHGELIVYGADEMYIKAERALPPLKDYGELPQIENGVGLVPLFLSDARKVKIPASKGKYLTFTGVSFYPFLKRFLERVSKAGLDITPVRVENAFFGELVTVTGLLTGRDIIKTISAYMEKTKLKYDMLLMPDCVLREGHDVFLDDVSVKDVEKIVGLRVKVVESTPAGLLEPFN